MNTQNQLTKTDGPAGSLALDPRSAPSFEEAQCTMPKFFPGDVVKTAAGEIGLIVQAQVIVNGCKIEWNGELPDNIKHGWPPCYALDAIPGFPRPHKCAWWTASEWSEVMRGPLHAVLYAPNNDPVTQDEAKPRNCV